MVRDNDMVAIFHSIHRVMKAEKILKGAQADILLIPTPRELSSDCGLALRYAPTEQERIATLLAAHGMQPTELYQYRAGSYQRIDAGTP